VPRSRTTGPPGPGVPAEPRRKDFLPVGLRGTAMPSPRCSSKNATVG